jgi:hypothetical protein
MGGFGTFSSLHHGVVEAAFVKEKMLEPRGRPKLHHSLLGPAPHMDRDYPHRIQLFRSFALLEPISH